MARWSSFSSKTEFVEEDELIPCSTFALHPSPSCQCITFIFTFLFVTESALIAAFTSTCREQRQ